MELHANLSIEAQPTNLRFRAEKEGAKGMLKSEDGPVRIKLSLQEKAAVGEKYFVTCNAAAKDRLVDGLIQLSSHALKLKGAHKIETISGFMKPNDEGLNYVWTLPDCWIVSGAGGKLEHIMELPNITRKASQEDRKKSGFYLAFTVFKYDNNSNTYTKCTSTIFSKCIFNAKTLSIDGFIIDNQDHMLMLLSDTLYDYKLNVRHLDEQNNNSTCCEINDLSCISEKFIEGQRDRQKCFRKSSKLVCYPRPQLRCLLNNPVRRPLKLHLQLHHDHIRSNVHETLYTPSTM